jgi:hypothetical protein
MGTADRIRAETATWPGVHEEPGRFGSVRLLVGRRELGHLHGDALLDLPLPRRLKDELLREGRVGQHRFEPESGWATLDLRGPDDETNALSLLWMQYERATSSP